MTFTLASSFARRHMRACRGLKNSRYMAGEICGPFCIPRSSPKRMMSMYGPTAPRNRSRLARWISHQPVEKLVRPAGFAGQQHEELVVAVQELADFQQIAAEQADNRPVGLCPQLAAPPRRAPARRRARRPAGPAGWHAAPHVLGRAPRASDRGRRFRDTASSTGRNKCAPSGIRASDPPARATAAPIGSPSRSGSGPGRHLAGRAVRQRPVGPVAVLEREPTAQLDRVDPEPVEHVVVDNRQLLQRVVDADRPSSAIPMPGEAWHKPWRRCRGAVAAQVDRHPVRLPVVERRQDTFSWCHSQRS